MRIDAHFVEYEYATAEREAFFQIVRDHEDRQVRFAPEAKQQFVHVAADTGVECPERFVKQQHAWFHHQRLRDCKALLHAARKLLRVLVQCGAQADAFEHGNRMIKRRAAARAEQPAGELRLGQFQPQQDIADHAQMFKYRVALEHHATMFIRLGRQGFAVEQDLAARRLFLTQQQAQERGLAATGRPDHRTEFAFGNAQVEPLKYDLIAVFLPYVAYFDHRAPPPYHGNIHCVRRLSASSINHASSVIHITYGRITSIAR